MAKKEKMTEEEFLEKMQKGLLGKIRGQIGQCVENNFLQGMRKCVENAEKLGIKDQLYIDDDFYYWWSKPVIMIDSSKIERKIEEDENFISFRCAFIGSMVREGNQEMIDLLLDIGVPIDEFGDMGDTPLIMAFFMKNWEMVRFLLSKGADPKKVSRDYEKLDTVYDLTEDLPDDIRKTMGW